MKQVFQAALDRPLQERLAFVCEACRDDPAGQREVESLLLAHEQAGDFAERPAVERLATGSAAVVMSGDSVTLDRALQPGFVLGRIRWSTDRPRRHGRGLSGERYAAGADRRYQGAARTPRDDVDLSTASSARRGCSRRSTIRTSARSTRSASRTASDDW